MAMRWIAFGRFWAMACAAFALGSCGVHLPDTVSYESSCPDPVDTTERIADRQLFFVSTSLPDCRGPRLRLAPYRFPVVTYGVSTLPDGSAQPWAQHQSVRHTEASWRKMLERSLGQGDNAGRVLVYVHGYNNAYEDALERGFKLSRLYWQGVPVVVFSWPSRNRVQSYSYDESSVAWAQDMFDALLLDLAERSSDITLVGHSMGNRAAIQAALRLDRELGDRPNPLRRIVLASPDVDRDEMLRPKGAIDRLLIPGRDVVIYASSKDRPLAFSRMTHGYARLGSTACRYDVEVGRRDDANCLLIPTRPHLSIVDTSEVSAGDIWRHSDFVDSCPARTDLAQFLRGQAPTLREPVSGSGTTYTLSRDLAEAQGLCPEGANGRSPTR